MEQHVFLWGMMGSGKSTLGAPLADLLGLPFVDLDAYIEATVDMTIPQLFDKWGQDEFRRLEHKALVQLLKEPPAVVSCGGGTPCYYDNHLLMLQHGQVVYLQAEVETLATRLEKDRHTRPLLKDETATGLHSFLAHMLHKRQPFYKLAPHILQVDTGTGEELTQRMALLLKQQPTMQP